MNHLIIIACPSSRKVMPNDPEVLPQNATFDGIHWLLFDSLATNQRIRVCGEVSST